MHPHKLQDPQESKLVPFSSVKRVEEDPQPES